jgi:hypothetical protein
MANVFIFTIDDTTARENFGITIEKGVELDTLLPFIQDEIQIENLRRFYPDGKCYVWGVQEKGGDNLSTWNSMVEEDLVLGYRDRSIVSASYVLMKMNNPSLATKLWSKNTEEPFRLMCFTDKPHLGEVQIVSMMFRYLDQEYKEFTKLNSQQLDNIMRDYGFFETFVQLVLGYDAPFIFRHSL